MAHILFMTIPAHRALDPTVIESKLDKAKDWIRFAPNSWLIHTEYSADAWFRQIDGLPDLQGAMVFICAADVQDLSGKLSPFAWNWIRKIRFGESGLTPPDSSQPQAVSAA